MIMNLFALLEEMAQANPLFQNYSQVLQNSKMVKSLSIGISLKNKKQNLEIRKNIGIVFQNPENQIIFDKVYDDLKFGLQNLGFSNEETNQNIDEALKAVDMLKYKNSNSSELSLRSKAKNRYCKLFSNEAQSFNFGRTDNHA